MKGFATQQSVVKCQIVFENLFGPGDQQPQNVIVEKKNKMRSDFYPFCSSLVKTLQLAEIVKRLLVLLLLRVLPCFSGCFCFCGCVSD